MLVLGHRSRERQKAALGLLSPAGYVALPLTLRQPELADALSTLQGLSDENSQCEEDLGNSPGYHIPDLVLSLSPDQNGSSEQDGLA